MSREVMKQAIEALEEVTDVFLDTEGRYGDYELRAIDQANKAAHALRKALAEPDNTSKLYEELRVLIDGGSESFTHKDAVQYLKDNLEPLEWTPEDTAYRPGGLAQPEKNQFKPDWNTEAVLVDEMLRMSKQIAEMQDWEAVAADQALTIAMMKIGQPLTNGEIYTAYVKAANQTLRPQDERIALAFARAIEATHGIGDKARKTSP